jgi:regulator of CtrA degradation
MYDRVVLCHQVGGCCVSVVSFRSGVTVLFGDRLAASGHFDQVFKDGMALVERTAAYLDGTGRKEAKALSAGLGVVYATESMRLTTRLLEIAAWLLVRRSLKEGEISAEDARVKRRCIKLGTIGRPSHVKGFAELPQTLRSLIEESFVLNDRIVHLDKALDVGTASAAAKAGSNVVHLQMHRLEQAFGTLARH